MTVPLRRFHPIQLLLSAAAWLATASGQTYEWKTLAGSTAGAGFQDGPAGVAKLDGPVGVVIDAAGNFLVTEDNNHTIRKISPGGVVSTVAGLGGMAGTADGKGASARFNHPAGLVVDQTGMIFVADMGNHAIRRVAPDGSVTTIAGVVGVPGNADGAANEARFSSPAAVAIAPNGDLVVADSGNHSIRRITPGGEVSTIAGLAGVPGFEDGAPGMARFRSPHGVAVGSRGEIYVADSENNAIRLIQPEGEVTTLAGAAGHPINVDGIGTEARFAYPVGIALTTGGDIFVLDPDAGTVRRIAATDHEVTTLAGMPFVTGDVNGQGSAARFSTPFGLALDRDGTLLVADTGNNSLRRVTDTGVVTTLFSTGRSEAGSTDAAGTAARFRSPYDLAVAGNGAIFVTDTGNRTVRVISPVGEVTTLAGTPGQSGTTDANGADARFISPRAITVGPGGTVYVSDAVNSVDSTVRKISRNGSVSTFSGAPGSLAPSDTFYYMAGLAADAFGNVFATDYTAVRKIDATGTASFLAGRKRLVTPGSPVIFFKTGDDDGQGTAATFSRPWGIALGSGGNLFIAETGGCVVRRVTSSGLVTTLAGSPLPLGGTPEYRDGTGSAARFNRPEGIAVDGSGNLYIADSFSSTIRRMSPGGVVTTIGGLPGHAGSGDGVGDRALFRYPDGIAVDSAGKIYVADTANHRIVMGTPLPVPEIVVELPDRSHFAAGGPGLDFGSVIPGKTSATQVGRIINTGNAPLTITALTLSGPDAVEFALVAPGLPGSIPVGGSAEFRVTASPESLGPRGAVLSILNDDPDEGTLSVSVNVVGNSLPVFNGYAASVPYGESVTISLVKLLAAATDPDGDALTVSAVAYTATTKFGVVRLLADSVQFIPFLTTYSGTAVLAVTVTDARGGSTTANVTATIRPSVAGGGANPANPPKVTALGGGKIGVSFHGIPGHAYRIERSTNLSTWLNLGNTTADDLGNVSFIDSTPPQPSGYYRIALP